MKTIKVMSIIGLVLFSISFLCILGFIDVDNQAAAGWGIIGMLYAIPYSIVGIVKSKAPKASIAELQKLNDLKEQGIISEEEFNTKKAEIL